MQKTSSLRPLDFFHVAIVIHCHCRKAQRQCEYNSRLLMHQPMSIGSALAVGDSCHPFHRKKNQDLPWSMGDLTVCGCIHVVESQSSMTFSKMVYVFSKLWEFTDLGWFWNPMNLLDRIWPLCSATHSRVCMNFPWWSTPTGMPGCEIVTSRKKSMLMHVEDCWSSFVHF